ncbi:hypothetical protein KJ662_05590 [Patescibacteria group bacterium]|nr:hypothetical protein [Patescibacteria group bacterium]MBU1685693.1 hypothetical protein [Patescibacteria group bacterium]
MKTFGLVGTRATGKQEFIGQPSDYATINTKLDALTESGGDGYARVDMFAIARRDLAKRRKFRGADESPKPTTKRKRGADA